MDILTLFLVLLKIIGAIILILLIIIISLIFCNIKVKTIFKYTQNDGIYIYTKITYLFGIIAYIFNNKINRNDIYIFGLNINKYKKNARNRQDKNIKIEQKNKYNHIKIEQEKNKKKEDEKVKKESRKKQNDNKKNIQEKGNTKDIILKIIQEKEVLKLTIDLIKKLLKCIKIQKNKIQIEYGLDDPSLVGIICAITNNIIPYLPNSKQVYIEPNFNEEIFVSNIEIIAKTNIFKIAMPIIKYILQKPIKNLYKK